MNDKLLFFFRNLLLLLLFFFLRKTHVLKYPDPDSRFFQPHVRRLRSGLVRAVRFTTAGTPCPKGATRGRCKSCTLQTVQNWCEAGGFTLRVSPNVQAFTLWLCQNNYGKSPFLMGKSTINGPCSIAMLVYQRVVEFLKILTVETTQTRSDWMSYFGYEILHQAFFRRAV